MASNLKCRCTAYCRLICILRKDHDQVDESQLQNILNMHWWFVMLSSGKKWVRPLDNYFDLWKLETLNGTWNEEIWFYRIAFCLAYIHAYTKSNYSCTLNSFHTNGFDSWEMHIETRRNLITSQKFSRIVVLSRKVKLKKSHFVILNRLPLWCWQNTERSSSQCGNQISTANIHIIWCMYRFFII